MVLRRAVDAGGHGAAGPAGRDAPEGEGAEGVGRRAGLGRVVRVEAVFVQELREPFVVRPTVFLEQGRADLGNLDFEQGFLVAQAFAAGAVISAEPRVDLDGRAVDVEGRDVGRDDAGVRSAHAVVDAVERRREVVVAQEPLVGEHRLRGETSGGRQIERAEALVFDRHDAFAWTELRDDLGVIAGQRAFPAERVDAIGE